jgi:hypothetical protein
MTAHDDQLYGIPGQSPAEREQEIQETLQGIAEVLARESGLQSPT